MRPTVFQGLAPAPLFFLKPHTWPQYVRLVRLGQSFFALPFVLMTSSEIFISHPSTFSAILLGKIVGCFLLLRATAMSFNRLVDASYDAKNPRTKNRELPQGKLTTHQVAWLTILSGFAFLLLAASISWICFWGGVLLLGLALLYSYTKRWTAACHFLLGLCIGLSPIAVSVAILQSVSLLAVIWTACCMTYIIGFDLIYSTMDMQVDRKAGLHSFPVSFGKKRSIQAAAASLAICTACLLWSGYTLQLDSIFFFVILGLGMPIMVGEILTGLELRISTLKVLRSKLEPNKKERTLGLLHIALGQVILIAYSLGRF